MTELNTTHLKLKREGIMKFKSIVTLLIVFLVFVVCSQGDVSNEQAATSFQKFYGTGYEYLKTEARVKKYKAAELRDIFRKRDLRLGEFFNSNNFSGLAAEFEYNPEIVTESDVILKGKKEIENYFTDLSQNIKEVSFTTDYIRITIRKWLEDGENEDDLLYSIRAITVMAYDLKGGSPHETVLETSWFHPRRTWPQD